MTSAAPVSQRSWVRFPFKPEFFQVSSLQTLRLKHLHCDDLHIILSLSAVQIYEFHILMFISIIVVVIIIFEILYTFSSFLRGRSTDLCVLTFADAFQCMWYGCCPGGGSL